MEYTKGLEATSAHSQLVSLHKHVCIDGMDKSTIFKEVLVVFNERRRVVRFTSSTDSSQENQHLLEAVRATFSDVLEAGEGSSKSDNGWYLQVESKEWGEVDVTGGVSDRATIFIVHNRNACDEKAAQESVPVKGLCQKLRTPSETTKKALSTLFPACSSVSSSTKKRKFDPTEECVVATQHQKKKASNPKYKGRAKVLTVVVLKKIPTTIPRGPLRKRLEAIGRKKDLHFHRIMSEKEVNDVMFDGFEDIGIKGFRYLMPMKDNTLAVAKKQGMDGNAVIQLAGSGSIYLQECLPSSFTAQNVCSLANEEKQLQLAKHLNKTSTKSQPIWISSDESEGDSVNIQESKSEWHHVWAEQDCEYFEGLQMDIAKEEAQKKEMENQQKIKENQTEWNRQVKELQDKMKLKFVGSNKIDGIRVGFKLPNGTKIEYTFQINAVVKDMYQFVISKEVVPLFTLFLSHPQTPLPLSTMADQPITAYENTLLLVICDDTDKSDLFTELNMLACFENRDLENCDADVVNEFVDEEVSRKDEEERMEYMKSINAVIGTEHFINRTTVYEDVINLYRKDEILKECPIYIEFIGEMAVDYGGVQRDMYAAFWQKAYSALFEGATLLTPMIHPQMDMSLFTIIGRILSHGYLVSGVLPVRIALPTMICMLLGPVSSNSVSDKILLNTFLDFISTCERSTLKSALALTDKAFPEQLQEELTTLLATFGCRQLPTPSSLPNLIKQVARYQFLIKPAASIAMINCGVPTSHQGFWSRKSPGELCSIYQRLTVSPRKVMSLIPVPEFCSPQEDRIYQYLRTMVGNMQPEELRLFMRFITGSCVCTTSKINITFNSLAGFARRPIAHTCNCTLEIPITYINYDDFHREFYSILTKTDDEFTWMMDAL